MSDLYYYNRMSFSYSPEQPGTVWLEVKEIPAHDITTNDMSPSYSVKVWVRLPPMPITTLEWVRGKRRTTLGQKGVEMDHSFKVVALKDVKERLASELRIQIDNAASFLDFHTTDTYLLDLLVQRCNVMLNCLTNQTKGDTTVSNNEATIEKEIQSKGLTAPRITPEAIDSVITGSTYTVLPSGKCMICELTLKNGYTVTGEASVVSKENFNEEIGRKVSYEKARDKIWQLEGYILQEKLAYLNFELNRT